MFLSHNHPRQKYEGNPANWSIRPNPEGRIIRKPEGQITDEMSEQLENWKAE